MYIGKFRHQIDASAELDWLSKEDERAAEALAHSGYYRQACYHIVQAMEKAVRAKIFTLVNPNLEYFRDRNRTHSLDAVLQFLIEIISADQIVQEQVSGQLRTHVLGDTKYGQLHNNLRYPTYFRKYDSYSMLDVQPEDYETLKARLNALRIFLRDLHRFM